MSGVVYATHEVLNQSPPVVARLSVERLAHLAATAALNAISPRQAERSARTRLAGNHGGMYGAGDLPSDDIRRLLDRALAH